MSLKTFFFPLAVIISVFLVIWFIIPNWEDVQGKREELRKKEEISLSLNKKITKISEEILVYNENSRDLAVIYQALPSELDNDVLVDEIFEGAKRNGVLITKVDVGKVEAIKKEATATKQQMVVAEKNQMPKILQPDVFKISLKLDLTGNYIGIKNFINYIETAKRLFAVDNFEIKQANEEGGSVSALLSISCFYKKENNDLKISSAVYDVEDNVMKDLTDQGKGLDTDFILQYKESVKNGDYMFNPTVITAGKNDLFSK